MDDYYTINKLQDDTAVFLNYWNLPEPFASAIRVHNGMTILTGRNAEISASSISGYNIEINSLLETKASEEGNVPNTEKLKACIRLTVAFASLSRLNKKEKEKENGKASDIMHKFSQWVKTHKQVFLGILFSVDILLNGLILIDPYSIENIFKERGQNYKECKMKRAFGKCLLIVMTVEKLLLVMTILFLVFKEWNVRKIYYELRFIMFSLYSNLLLIIVAFIIDLIHFNNYYVHFVLQEIVLILISLLIYSCLYGYKLFYALLREKNIAFFNNEGINYINDSDIKSEKTSDKTTMTMMTNMTSICESNGNGNNGSGNITNGNIGSGNIAYGYNGNGNGENIGNNKWNVNNSGKVSNNT